MLRSKMKPWFLSPGQTGHLPVVQYSFWMIQCSDDTLVYFKQPKIRKQSFAINYALRYGYEDNRVAQ